MEKIEYQVWVKRFAPSNRRDEYWSLLDFCDQENIQSVINAIDASSYEVKIVLVTVVTKG